MTRSVLRQAGPTLGGWRIAANPVEVAHEPGPLDRERSPKLGVDGPGTVCDGHGLRHEAGASKASTNGRTSVSAGTCSVTGARGYKRCGSKLESCSSRWPVSVTRGTTTGGCVDQGKLAAWTRMRVYPC